MKPTQIEIDEAIELLTKLKGKIPHYSMFNDDNHKLIDLEIQVLNGYLKSSDIFQYSDMIASSLLDVVDWKKGDNKDWFNDRKGDLEIHG